MDPLAPGVSLRDRQLQELEELARASKTTLPDNNANLQLKSERGGRASLVQPDGQAWLVKQLSKDVNVVTETDTEMDSDAHAEEEARLREYANRPVSREHARGGVIGPGATFDLTPS